MPATLSSRERAVLKARAHGFEGQLRAETHGRASCSIRFAHYHPVVQAPASESCLSAGLGFGESGGTARCLKLGNFRTLDTPWLERDTEHTY
jgi:translation elongation factor EF-G